MTSAHEIQIGLEQLLASPPDWTTSGRWGLLANQASVDASWRYTWDAIAAKFPSRLVKLFSPQHGLWGTEQANMIETAHAQHVRLDIPIYSLYSETRRPTAEMLQGLDLLLIDLQDVGTRVYTFIWTITHCLEACAELGLPVVILDRPNPLGGELCEGPAIQSGFFSFVGRWSIPMRHGLTIGELARFCNRDMGIHADLSVIPMRGWSTSDDWSVTGRGWAPPSPNMPTERTTWSYPGQVLLEGTNISEGRGTTLPFEVCGAPFIDAETLVKSLEDYQLPGVTFRPLQFQPTFDKFAGVPCGGLMQHVTDPSIYQPYLTTICILSVIKHLNGDQFAWLPPPYEYEEVLPPVDILTGSASLRTQLEDGRLLSRETCDSLADPQAETWWERTRGDWLYSRHVLS